jgi:alpha-D-ribose 1-methylphosphonate 5-phosphate C-P lyase
MIDCQNCCKKITSKRPYKEKVVIDNNGRTMDILYCNKKCFKDKQKKSLEIHKRILGYFR